MNHEIPVEVIRKATDEKPNHVSIAELEAEHIASLLLSYNGPRRNIADTLTSASARCIEN